jgi:hypothetical protein
MLRKEGSLGQAANRAWIAGPSNRGRVGFKTLELITTVIGSFQRKLTRASRPVWERRKNFVFEGSRDREPLITWTLQFELRDCGR